MINIDGSLFIQIANFIFLIWALNTVMYKPIRRALAQRNNRMDGLQENIENFQDETRQKDEAYINGIKTARVKGLDAKAALMDEAAEEEKRIIAEINARAQADLAANKKKIAADAEEVRRALEAEVDGFANAIGQKILGRAF